MLMPRYRVTVKTLKSSVMRQMQVKYRRALFQIGAYTRTVAKNSLKKPSRRRPTSSPYGVPLNQTGAIKNHLQFDVTDDSTSVVIGPTLLPRPKNKFRPLTVNASRNATRLSILIFGGRQRSQRGNVNRFAPRPFMQIAREKALQAPRLKAAFREIGS